MGIPLQVLIVEDSEDDALLLVLELRRSGYDVTFERVDTAKAMQTALTQRNWDIVIADYRMPRFSGLDALKLLQSSGLDLPFIVVSGTIGEDLAVQAMKAGASDYIMKDNLTRLAPAIERELREAKSRRKQRHAETTLQRQTELLQIIFDNIPVLISSYNAEGRLTLVNREWERVLGWSLAEAQGRDMLAELYPNPKEYRRAVEFIAGAEPGWRDFKMKTRNGQIRDISWANIRLSDGTVLGFGQDVTERNRQAETLRRRNRELTLLNRVIAASATGLTTEEILKTTCRELAQALDLPRAIATQFNEAKTKAVVIAEYLPEGHPTLLNTTFAIKGNAVFQYLLAHKAPLVVDESGNADALDDIRAAARRRGVAAMMAIPLVIDGEVVGVLELSGHEPRRFSGATVSLAWSVADQMAGVLARARLYTEHRRLSKAVEQATESVIITDTAGTIIYVNPAFEQTTGYSRAEAVGQKPSILKSGKHNRNFYQTLWATITRGDTWRGQFINKKKDGALYTEEAVITPMRSETGAITNYVAVKRDVTRELELEEQYRQAHKMEAIGRLTGGIAHDFNNLLTAINGFAELMQMRLPPDDPHQEMVSSILRSGQSATELISQLMAFSRSQFIEPKILNLNTVVNNVEKILNRIIGEDITLTTRCAPDLWPVTADPAQMEQIIMNLAVNARDAMPNGGRLTIETANALLDEAYTADHLEAWPGRHVLLAVSDTGIGMTPEIQAHIFEPFYTTKEKGKGTGLGLATVYGIVKQNRGHIRVYSEVGTGTTFKIYLPCTEESELPAAEAAAPGQAMPGGAETILLVEDDDNVRDLVREVLQQLGYNLLEAASGEAALKVAAGYNDPIHLLLTDVVMPGIPGRVLAEKLLSTRPGLKLIFMSGYTPNSIAHHGVLEPNVAFIQKPLSPHTLAHKVREVLDT